ncbi:MAG: PRC-barrel domain-containing protein [Dehalococcoidia bacterium]|nr:PRC-barrel domain-containing protein [Dehalococcoidia bacterium]
MLVKKLLGKEVIGSRGDKIGKMADLDIDIVSGVVKSAVINAGLRTKYKIKLDDIVTVGDTIILRLSGADLKKSVKK